MMINTLRHFSLNSLLLPAIIFPLLITLKCLLRDPAEINAPKVLVRPLLDILATEDVEPAFEAEGGMVAPSCWHFALNENFVPGAHVGGRYYG